MAKKAKKQRKPIVKVGAFFIKLFRYFFGRCFVLCLILARIGGGYVKKNRLLSLGFFLFFSSFIAISYNAMYSQNFAKEDLINSAATETIDLAGIGNSEAKRSALAQHHAHKHHKTYNNY